MAKIGRTESWVLQKMGNLVKIFFNPMNREIEVERGRLLLDAIREADIRIESICGGKGECGKCKVILNRGEVSSLSTSQKKHLSPQEIAEGYRLACQIRVLGDSEFIIPVESRIDRPKILLSMELAMDRLDPASKKYLMKVSPFRDYEQMLLHRSIKLEGYSGPAPRMDHKVYDKLLSMEHEAPVTVTLTRSNNYPEIINVESGNRTRSNYGLAIDVGTTTIAILLVDLISGKVSGRESGLNRQITYGEELIPRIAFAREPNGLKKLQMEAVKSINDIVDQLTSRIEGEHEEITDICVGGNTVMNHLLAGMDPTYLSMANVEVSRRPIILEAKAVGIHANPDAYLYCLPNVSRFLGGDAVGDVIASGMYDSDKISLTVDMGTNGEIIFGNKSWLVSCSCASGPAFEGEGIKFGMRAMRGGIEHVKIDPKTFESEYTVTGDTRPKGICGSGIIDLAAEMFSVGILDFAGKIVKGRTPLVRRGRDGLEYVVVPAEKTAIGRDIVITQRDMNYVMDSKAAACGAITVLMKKLKLSIYDIQSLYLAGAFGAYTDLSNATKLGIFPEFPNAKIRPIGNGSLSGAYATLLSVENREKARAIAENMVYIDLLVDVEFTERYSEAIYIPGKKEFFPSASS